MVMPTVSQLGAAPTAHPPPLPRTCGHSRHVATCPVCQRPARTRSQRSEKATTGIEPV
jgi:hypothetical protein